MGHITKMSDITLLDNVVEIFNMHIDSMKNKMSDFQEMDPRVAYLKYYCWS